MLRIAITNLDWQYRRWFNNYHW